VAFRHLRRAVLGLKIYGESRAPGFNRMKRIRSHVKLRQNEPILNPVPELWAFYVMRYVCSYVPEPCYPALFQRGNHDICARRRWIGNYCSLQAGNSGSNAFGAERRRAGIGVVSYRHILRVDLSRPQLWDIGGVPYCNPEVEWIP